MKQLLCWGSCWLLCQGVASATPVLLGEFRQVGGTSRFSPVPVPPVVSVSFDLMIGFPTQTLCSGADLTLLDCEPRLAPFQTGVFDFDALNAPNFAAMSSRLTDAMDERLLGVSSLYDVSGALVGAGASGSRESDRFGGLLTGRVDFFRLIVEQNDVENRSDGLGYKAGHALTWQVWGAIPVPSTLLLVGAGIIALVGNARRRVNDERPRSHG